MRRSVFHLPAELQCTYMAAIELVAQRAVADLGLRCRLGPVLDRDVAERTHRDPLTTRAHLLELSRDMLEVDFDSEWHLCVRGMQHN
jgi:hypothetical protein